MNPMATTGLANGMIGATGWTSLMPLAPMLVISLTAVMVMIAIALKRSNTAAGTISVAGLNIALVLVIWGALNPLAQMQGVVSSLFVVDSFAQFNMGVILVCALACFTLAHGYIENSTANGLAGQKEELYILMLIATLGALLMACTDHMAAFFVSLELLSVPMYGMLAYTYAREQSLEAGMKYLVLSATASATLLMGMALIYACTGTLSFRQIGMATVNSLQTGMNVPLLVVGAAMILFAIAFKLSAAPFHTWTPDVYQGAPAPVATFLGSVSKVATLVVGVRFLLTSATLAIPTVQFLLVIIATLSILLGNVLALRERNAKRVLAYSSIAHLGYVLAVVSAVTIQSVGFASLYMAVYALTTVGSFGVISIMSSPYQGGEAQTLDDYRGLFWQRPILTAVLTVMLLSLAGVPLTAGFISKFYAIFATASAQAWWLTAMIIVGSAIGLYYYLNFMVSLFKRAEFTREQNTRAYDAVNHWGLQAGGIMVLLVTLAIVYLGVFPEWLSKILLAIKIY